MNETESHIAQAIQYAKEGNPNDMQDSLSAALSNKITDAINLKKIELAGEFFGEKNDEDEDEEENGSEEEEENGKNGKKKKKNPFAKKNGDDDEDDDDDEEEDVEEEVSRPRSPERVQAIINAFGSGHGKAMDAHLKKHGYDSKSPSSRVARRDTGAPAGKKLVSKDPKANA